MASSTPSSNGQSNGHHSPTQQLNGLLYAPDEAQDGASQLRETLGLLWQGKWIILAVLVLVVGAASVYTFTLSPEYETSSLLLIEAEQTAATQGMSSDVRETLGIKNRTLENELLVLQQSEDIAGRVAGRLLAASDTLEAQDGLSLLYNDEGQLLSHAAVAARLGQHMRANPAGRDVDAIRIVGASHLPSEAALIANLYAEEYIARTQEKSRSDIKGSRAFLEDQEQKLQAELEQLEDRIRQYMSQEKAADLDQEASRTVEQIAQLEAQRDETRIELEMKEAALQSLREELEEIEPKLVERASSEAGQSLEGVLAELKELDLRIEQIYQANPPLRDGSSENEKLQADLARLERRRERLREKADDLSADYVDEVLAVGGINPGADSDGRGLSYVAEQRRRATQQQIEISGLRAKLGALNQRLEEYQEKLKDIPRQSIELAQMDRSRRATERLYSFIVEKLQEVRIAEESEIGYAEVIRQAGIPSRPVRPNTQRNLMLAVFFGLLLGGGLVLLRHRLDTRVHAPEDLRAKGHSVIGVIPDMKRLIDEEFGGKEYVSVEGRRLNTSLPMLLGSMSASAEAYRRLRTNIQFSRPDTVIETLLFTSPEQGEGKSVTSMNLAIALAQADRRTLVVDCDLRRPQVHRLLDLEREPGLSDILFEHSSFDPASFATGIDNLWALPAGSSVPNPAELLGSKKMRTFIQTLRETFDVVIFDTSPVLTFSDAMLLSTQCDATALVALAHITDERAYAHAYETLDDVGAHLIGGILNRFDASSVPYGYDYGYSYAYRYNRPEQYYEGDEKGTARRKRRARWF